MKMGGKREEVQKEKEDCGSGEREKVAEEVSV